MTDSFTPQKNYILMQTGNDVNQWGINLNSEVFSIIDNNLGGTLPLSVAGNSNVLLNSTQAQNIFHDLTGALTGSITYTFPEQGGFWIINNQTTGNYTITAMVTGSATGINIPQGQATAIYIDASAPSINYYPTYNPSAGKAFPDPAVPQGRLTLQSATPVMTQDVTGATTVYYAPYVGQRVPLYNGTSWIPYSIGSQLSLALDATTAHTGYQQLGKLYDLYAFLNGTTLTLGTGPAWTSATSRGTGAATAQIQQTNGLWVNAVTMSMKVDATATQVGVNPTLATYLGTMYAAQNGATVVQFKPGLISGGAGGAIGISNGYNRVRATALCQDNNTYNYASATWRPMDNSSGNSISWVDALAQIYVTARLKSQIAPGAAGSVAAIGVLFNTTVGTPNTYGAISGATATTTDNFQTVFSEESSYPMLGFNRIQAMESIPSGSATFNSTPAAATMSLALDIEY